MGGMAKELSGVRDGTGPLSPKGSSSPRGEGRLTASWAAVDLRAVVRPGLAVGVARLVLVTLAAAGFMAMHGVAATDPGGAHHNPMSVSATIEEGVLTSNDAGRTWRTIAATAS